ncbi:MAG: hypothetical protein EA001_12620 [Oscillatoriales cyanobacterium]|nr:MAG: hypothetical protein EA001_12620 [Oscillatoriales cyanobacterium]
MDVLPALPAARWESPDSIAPEPVTPPPPPATLARPIVCLEHDRWQLLAEEIDRNPDRQTSWVRPLVLADYGSAAARQGGDRPQKIYTNNEDGVDLVLPSDRLRLAFDVELLALFADRSSDQSVTPDPKGRTVFQVFVRSLF